jgi:CheY-like chemotaxis protein
MTKILLVEDDKSLREIYGVRLLAEGYDIVSAGDGEEALAMAIKERPQLIVSDVMMPKISGFDMLDILRSTTETKNIKVIMMTALSSEDQRARGEALGADRYLVKSQVGIEDVVRTVHDVLADSLTPTAAPTSSFGAPALSAIARPATPVAPRPEQFVAPAPFVAAPIAPAPAPIGPQPVYTPPVEPIAVAFAPQPQPVSNPIPVNYAPQPVASPLPQPFAPFGSDRPASLGDRVIHPLTDQTPQVDVANLMAQELSIGAVPALTPVQPPVPPTPGYSDPLAPGAGTPQ